MQRIRSSLRFRGHQSDEARLRHLQFTGLSCTRKSFAYERGVRGWFEYLTNMQRKLIQRSYNSHRCINTNTSPMPRRNPLLTTTMRRGKFEQLHEQRKGRRRKVKPYHQKGLNVALVGCPNVGKSLLVNRLVREKISAVSPKVNTTRRSIRGVKTCKNTNTQLVFIDLPGFVEMSYCQDYRVEGRDDGGTTSLSAFENRDGQNTNMGERPTVETIDDDDGIHNGDVEHHNDINIISDRPYLQYTASSTPRRKIRHFIAPLRDIVDKALMSDSLEAVMLIVDATTHPERFEYRTLDRLERIVAQMKENHSMDLPLILCMNKMDLLPSRRSKHLTRRKRVTLERHDMLMQELKKRACFDDILTVSALKGWGLNELETRLRRHVRTRPWEYGFRDVTSLSEEERVTEIVRSHLFRRLNREVPYKSSLHLLEMCHGRGRDERTTIRHQVVVQTKSHQRILRGARHFVERAATQDLQIALKCGVDFYLSIRLSK